MINLNPVNEVPKCKKWRQDRIHQMVKEMWEHGVKPTLTINPDFTWNVSFWTLNDKGVLSSWMMIDSWQDNAYEMVERCYMATVNCDGELRG